MNERYVYLKNGDEIVKQQQFSCESKKLKIIEKWKSLYGKKFHDLTIAEEPKIIEPKTEKSMENKYVYGGLLINRNKGAIRKNMIGFQE